MAFVFCPGHVLGRVGMAEMYVDRMRTVFNMIVIEGQEECCDADEAECFLRLARMGLRACEHAEKELGHVRHMALAHNAQSVRAAAGKEG